jgi:potassium-dependent mechanosensitive channel
MTGFWRTLALIVGLALAGPALAQTTDDAGAGDQTTPTETPPATPESPTDIGGAPKGQTGPATGGATTPTRTIRIITSPALDYAAWNAVALRAEDMTSDDRSTAEALEAIRIEVVDWRERLLAVQNTNDTRIETVRTQLNALGPVPTDGAVDPPEIAARRGELNDQLTRLQAPGITAQEAYRRADGLINEIDRVLRDRKADELLKLWPMPVNPANWPAAIGALRDMAVTLYDETRRAVRWPSNRVTLGNNLPLILLYLALALGLLWRGRDWIDRLVARLQTWGARRAHRLWETLASLGQIVVPIVGVVALAKALQLSGMIGVLGRDIVAALPSMGMGLFLALWLGGRLFPHGDRSDAVLVLPPDRRAEGRVLAGSFGILLGVETLRRTAMNRLGSDEAAVAVLSFPILVIAGLLLMRLGRLLRKHAVVNPADQTAPTYRARVLGVVGQAAIVIAFLAMILAAVGYVSAAGALIFPAILSLALLGALFLLQQLVGDVYAAVAGDDEVSQQSLIPVLIGFALTLATLPILALIWGARVSDMTELWTKFREGFQLGETVISPTDFLVFAVVFGIGYSLTRLFQGGLKSTILPKTRLDRGGQNAISVGFGYVGIFLSALIAINSAGLDLSGLAIVAGALSVGIGFGLQTIVSNFVSGIILLIERPISEGDWIEVGTVQGIVKGISVRSTRIQTFDRNDVIVPNSDLITGRVTNWTRFNLTGRLIVPVTVRLMTDTRQVEKILQEIAEAQPLAVLNPAPIVVFTGFGLDVMNFEIRVVLRDVNFLVPVRSEINHAIAERFAAAEITFSTAHFDLRQRLEEQETLHAAETAVIVKDVVKPTRTMKENPA